MPTKNINLADHQAQFITQSVAHGRYKNASEVVRAGLRLLEQRDAEDRLRLEVLQRIAKEAVDASDRGEYTVIADSGVGDMFSEIDRTIRQG